MACFRQLVVNSVMATDVMDKDLKAIRDARWAVAFQQSGPESREDINRQITILVEHLMQASDIAHTMQHWHVYHKWNEKLFDELYVAYHHGRAENDPSEFWYEAELSFFNFVVVPLATKLHECGVLGGSSHEYLDCANKNRAEWERRGKEVVTLMLERSKTNCTEIQ